MRRNNVGLQLEMCNVVLRASDSDVCRLDCPDYTERIQVSCVIAIGLEMPLRSSVKLLERTEMRFKVNSWQTESLQMDFN